MKKKSGLKEAKNPPVLPGPVPEATKLPPIPRRSRHAPLGGCQAAGQVAPAA